MRATVETLTGGVRDADVLRRAGELIRSGELVAFPTETVYGLGANALDAAAVEKIFVAKGRPFGDPLIVHVASARDVDGVVASVPAQARELMARFWPGPLTLIMPRGARVPARVTAGRDTVAVRVPAHPIARALLASAGVPIAAPSANRFSRPSPTTAAHVADDLGDALDLILDGGPTTHGVESTVLDLTGERPVVLRPGAVTLEALREVRSDISAELGTTPPYDAARTAESGTQSYTSPGTMLKHYSPRAEVRFWSESPTVRAAMRRDAEQAIAAGKRVGVLLFDEDADALSDLACTRFALGSLQRLAEAASRLYDGLRSLDRAGVDVILARDPGAAGLGLTIRDRLYRAAEGRVLDSRH